MAASDNPISWILSKLSNSSEKGASASEVSFDIPEVESFLTTKSPFLYLTSSERKSLLDSSKCVRITGSQLEIMTDGESANYSPLLILDGVLTATDSSSYFCEQLKKGDSFGFDSCIFKTSIYTITTESESCLILAFSTPLFLELVKTEKQFSSIIGRNLLYKQNIFESIEKFLKFVDENREKGKLSIKKLVAIYENIGSALHPGVRSNSIDISAWKYALERLPDNITESFIYDFTTTLNDIFQNDSKVVQVSSGRKRTILSTIPGKTMIVLRESETDLNDFLSNLCIHYIECRKIRKRLKQPGILNALSTATSLNFLPLSIEEKEGINSIWGQKSCQILRNIALHHEDFYAIVNSSKANLKSTSSERLAEVIWKGCQEALGLSESVSEIIQKGMIVDVIQGSTKTLLNIISPYFALNAEKILKWFETSGVVLKTKQFFEERDKLFAASYYFFKKFPEELSAKIRMDREAGIVAIENTEMTGVKVYIANVSRLNCSEVPAKSPYHLLINIGYSFGKQGYDIIKCFTLLFGFSINSFAFIGKAGGLVGNRKEILLATKFYDMITKDITLVNPRGIKQKFFQKLGINVHEGGMLTVPGTILQNNFVLNYYKHIESCVGLEMEGYYYAQAIQESIDMSLVSPKIPTRFLYYVSDLPLDSTSNLSHEGENVSWDEGVPTMNAITLECIRLCGKKVSELGFDRVTKFVKNCDRVAFVMNYWDVAQEILNLGCPVVAFVYYKEEIPDLTGHFITVDYEKRYQAFQKIQEIFNNIQYKDTWTYSIFEYPKNVQFLSTEKVSLFDVIKKEAVYLPNNQKFLLQNKIKYFVGTTGGRYISLDGAGLCFEKTDKGYFTVGSGEKVQMFAKDIAAQLLS